MTKSKSISDLVTDLQKENESLQMLKKLFNQACKNEFGYDIKTVKLMLEKQRIYEAKKAERAAQKDHADIPHSPSMTGSNEGERKADYILNLDKTSAGLSDGGHSPISI